MLIGGGFGGANLVGSSTTLGVTDPDREGCLVVKDETVTVRRLLFLFLLPVNVKTLCV